LNHDAIAMARFFSGLLEQLTRLPKGFDHPTFDIFRCIGCGVVSWIAQKDE